jgi:cell division protein FtsN
LTARRGKSQARRNPGSGGLPGWAWALIGALIAALLILLVPRWLESDGEDFLRPQPNPDAQPAPASTEPLPAPAAEPTDEEPEYDFYTLLPGKEVPVSDAELAAQQRAEQAAQQQAEPADEDAADPALPQPVDAGGDEADRAGAGAERTATADDGSRYLLQAGSFSEPAQAEALKARIALLGMSARVVPATIDGRTVHRVQLGPFASATALAEAKRTLAGNGLPALAIKVK